MRKIILNIIMLLLCVSQLYAPPIKYASPTSTLKCSGKSKITAKKMLTLIGTLAQGANATLEGVNYAFDKATFFQDGGSNVTGSAILNANADLISCSDGQQVTSNNGSTVGQTIMFAGENASLEGVASNFTNPNTIVLADSSTTFNIALTSPLTTSIAFNGGTVKLIQDLKVSGSATFIGDGVVDFNIRSLIFDGNPRVIGGKVLFEQASDFIFNGRLTVTGELTFSGDSVMIGNGNIVDISQGGTIRIKRDTTVDFVGAKLKGLGIGQIVLEYPTSMLRLSNVEIEMNRDYSFTMGGIYAEGPTTIATKNHFLTFDLAGSLTIDGISLWNDPLIFQPMNNIQGNITTVNDGLIRDVVSSDLVNSNSNTLLFLNRNNSNTLLFLERTDSAAKLFLARNNSNALLFGDRNNSNALLFLNRTNSNANAQDIRNNSNTLLFLERTDSATKLFLARNLSNTLLFLNRTSSNADARGIRNNSNTLLFLDRTDSAAKLFLARNNSNALLFLNRNNSNTLLFLNRNNSNALLDLSIANSQALLDLTINNSNTLLFLTRNNSNTLLFLERTDSATKLFLTRNNSNTLLFLNRNNSNAIINLKNQLIFGCQDIAGKLDLFHCYCFGPGDCINIIGDACIDGHGIEIAFTDQPFAQFKVQEGVNVILKNITLAGINQNTFDLRDNASIQIGENVIWELDTDVTFSAHALIEVLDGTNECTPITGPCNVFTIRGETCRRAFKIQPLNDLLPNGQPRRTFDLGHNTVLLESAQISGFDYMTFFNDDMCAAAVALACDAGADVYSNFSGINGRFSSAMNFFVEGLNNDIILRQDGFVLAGNITFGDLPDNELHIRFNFAELLASSNSARTGVLPEFPVVELAGNPGMFLFSAEGVASLIFDDLNAAVRNSNDNSFVVDDNGLLVYKRLQVLDNPIKQQSALFRLEGLELLDQRIDPGFIRSPRFMSRHILITAMHIMRQQEKDRFEQAQKQAEKDAKKTSQTHNRPVAGKVNKKLPQPKHRGIDFEFSLDEGNTDAVRSVADELLIMRSLSLPASFDQSYVDQVLNPATPISGNIHYTRTEINNFIVDPGLAFNILIQDGSKITLGADVVLNSSHKINVKGLGNVINMPFGMTIGQDNIFLDEGAELTFQFSQCVIPTPELIISDNTVLDIEADTIVRLSGPGIATLGDGVVVNFNGVKTVHPVTKEETVSSRGCFIITEDATLRLAAGALARMKGVGSLEVTKRGKILLDAPSTLAFGIDEPTVLIIVNNVDPIFPSENFHDIVFNVFDDGEVIIKPGTLPGGKRAFISFRYLTSVIKFENGGFLFIDDNGIFQINARRAVPNPSRLNELSFRAGLLNVRGSGIFAMGSNKTNLGTGQPYPFSYDGVSSLIEGTGKARFIAPGKAGFEGFINPTPAARDEINPQTAFNLIRSLIGLDLI